MRLTINLNPDPTCREAVQCYAELLASAGWLVTLEENSESNHCSLIWGCEEPEESEFDDEYGEPWEETSRDDPGVRRILEHYGRTLGLLGSVPDLAGHWLNGQGRTGPRRRSARRKG